MPTGGARAPAVPPFPSAHAIPKCMLCATSVYGPRFINSLGLVWIPVRVFALDRLRQLLASYSKKTWHRLALPVPGLDSKGISSGFGDFWCPSFPGFFLTSCVYSIANWSRQLTSSESDQILTIHCYSYSTIIPFFFSMLRE